MYLVLGGTKWNIIQLRKLVKSGGVTSRMVNVYCSTGRIPGTIKKVNLWLVPEDAIKPEDQRRKKEQRNE